MGCKWPFFSPVSRARSFQGNLEVEAVLDATRSGNRALREKREGLQHPKSSHLPPEVDSDSACYTKQKQFPSHSATKMPYDFAGDT